MELLTSNTSQITTTQLRKQYVKCGTGDGTQVSGVFTNTFGGRRWGQKNPRWKTQVAAGESATTPFRGEMIELVRHRPDKSAAEYVPYVQNYCNGGTSKWHSETTEFDLLATLYPMISGISYAAISAYNLSDARSRAQSILASKTQDAVSRFQGATFTGELRETLSMIRSPFSSIRGLLSSYLDAVKKQRQLYKSPERLDKAIADTWLEYSFGLRPLINDIQNLLSLSQEAAKVPDVIRAVAESRKILSETRQTISPLLCQNVSYDVTIEEVCKVRYIARLGYSNGWVPENKGLGFDISAWAPTVWELIPYSWLVDYVSNLGHFIAALSNAATIGYRWGVETTHRSVELRTALNSVTSKTHAGFSGAKPMVSHVPGDWCLRKKVVERGAYSGLYIPSLSLRFPDFGTEWLNMAALYRQMVSTREILRVF